MTPNNKARVMRAMWHKLAGWVRNHHTAIAWLVEWSPLMLAGLFLLWLLVRGGAA